GSASMPNTPVRVAEPPGERCYSAEGGPGGTEQSAFSKVVVRVWFESLRSRLVADSVLILHSKTDYMPRIVRVRDVERVHAKMAHNGIASSSSIPCRWLVCLLTGAMCFVA